MKQMIRRLGRVGVLMGGPSSEREISLKSGKAVCQALKEQGADVVCLDIRNKAEQVIKRARISLAFIALHGRYGEDGTVQSILSSCGIPYTGSGALASYLCLDKVASRRIFRHHHIPVPDCELMTRQSWKRRLPKLSFKFPLVVKPANQGSSIGVTFVDRCSALKQALKLAFSYDDTALIEKYIRGREITVGILEDKPLPVIEIVPQKRFFDFQAKYERGKSNYIVPARLPKSQYQDAQAVGLMAHQALGCRTFSRVDMILSHSQPIVLEVNSIPGLTSTSLLPMAAKAEGIDFGTLCLKIIDAALKGNRKNA